MFHDPHQNPLLPPSYIINVQSPISALTTKYSDVMMICLKGSLCQKLCEDHHKSRMHVCLYHI